MATKLWAGAWATFFAELKRRHRTTTQRRAYGTRWRSRCAISISIRPTLHTAAVFRPYRRHVGARPVRLCKNHGARPTGSQSHGPDWPGTLKGRRRQVFDIYDINEGSPRGFTNNFLAPNESATAVMIFRHKGLPYALGSAMWEKYKIGESFNIPDPET